MKKKFLYGVVLLLLIVSSAWGESEIKIRTAASGSNEEVTSSAFNVAIDDVNFPDEVFRNFIINVEKEYWNGDGFLSESEASELTGISLNSRDISSLKGIEYFTKLESLSCSNNNIVSLDVSKNTALTELYCWNNQLKALDVSGNTSLSVLDCSGNQLTTLNLNMNKYLMLLHCFDNQLEALDLSNNTSLSVLRCSTNPLKFLDVSKNTALTGLRCAGNQLTTLNLSNNTALNELWCSGNYLSELDVSRNTNLTVLHCEVNQLKSLSVINNTALTELICSYNQLNQIDVSRNEDLTMLDCRDNNLTSLNLSNNRALNNLNCSNNQLASLDTRNNTALTELDCGQNKLTVLDMKNNTKLTELDCSGNQLVSLDITRNTALTQLDCSINNLRQLDITGNTALKSININNNQFAAVDFGSNSSLSRVGANFQRIINLELKEQAGSDYPYSINFGDYMTSSQINNILSSSVKGFDEDGSEIRTIYDNGTAKFLYEPETVSYEYDTGISGIHLGVKIGSSSYMTVSLNNHVYRIFTHEQKSYPEAKEYCITLGGHLATINSDEERKLLSDLIEKSCQMGDLYRGIAWIGGEKIGGKWSWVTSEDFNNDVSRTIAEFNEFDLISNDSFIANINSLYKNLPDPVYCLLITGNNRLYSMLDFISFSFICEWEPVSSDFAEYSEEYLRYIENPKDPESDGGEPEPFDSSYLNENIPVSSAAATLPAKFDPRTSRPLTPARQQYIDRSSGKYNTCWSFAAIGALEASYIAQGYGTSRTTPNLSELHMAWYVYKDPRNKYCEEMKQEGEPVLNQQGNDYKAIAFLSRAGTASENDLSYSSKADNIESNPPSRLPEDYDHPLRLREAYHIGAITPDKREMIKHFISDNGAVTAGYSHSSSKGLSKNQQAYYLNTTKGYGHLVSLVGWDDDYPKSNFDGTNQPDNNGAWLAKNSFGEDWGDSGYFWISYEQTIGYSAAYIADNRIINRVYGHDTVSAADAIPYNWSASVFRAVSRESFNEISFHTKGYDSKYEIYINRLGSGDEPVNPGFPEGQPVASGTMKYEGYHTIALRNPIVIEADEYFSVILKLSSTTYPYAAAVDTSGGVRAAGLVIPAGRSYFAMSESVAVSSDWVDGGRVQNYTGENKSSNACIRLFTTSEGTILPEPEEPEEPKNDNTEGNSEEGGGGGGCISGTFPAVMLVLCVYMALKKN